MTFQTTHNPAQPRVEGGELVDDQFGATGEYYVNAEGRQFWFHCPVTAQWVMSLMQGDITPEDFYGQGHPRRDPGPQGPTFSTADLTLEAYQVYHSDEAFSHQILDELRAKGTAMHNELTLTHQHGQLADALDTLKRLGIHVDDPRIAIRNATPEPEPQRTPVAIYEARRPVAPELAAQYRAQGIFCNLDRRKAFEGAEYIAKTKRTTGWVAHNGTNKGYWALPKRPNDLSTIVGYVTIDGTHHTYGEARHDERPETTDDRPVWDVECRDFNGNTVSKQIRASRGSLAEAKAAGDGCTVLDVTEITGGAAEEWTWVEDADDWQAQMDEEFQLTHEYAEQMHQVARATARPARD